MLYVNPAHWIGHEKTGTIEPTTLERENGSRGEKAKVANTFDVPWRWICKISVRKGGKYLHGGTGVLISDRHVLTAAHLVKAVAKDRAQFDLEVTPALSGNNSLDTYVSTAKPLLPSEYKEGESRFDYAVIRLDTAIGTKRFSALKKAPLCYWGSATCGAATVVNPVEARALVGKTGYSAGYPKNKGASAMWRVSGLLHSADKTGDVIWFTGDASEGQSGSPVWIRENNLYCLAGVLVAAGKSSSVVVPLTRARLAQIRAWSDESAGKEFEYDSERIDDSETEEELNARSRVDTSTPKWIQAALAKSKRLSPFLAQKLATVSVAKNFAHYGSDAEFNHAYMKFRKIVVPFDSPEYKAANVRGYFDRATGTIHLRPTADLGQAVRLAMKKFSSPAFGNFFGPRTDEGVALYFANALLAEQGMKPIRAEEAAPALTCASNLAAVVGEAAVAKAFFQSHTDLITELTTKLSVGPVATTELTNDQLCTTALLPTARFAKYQLTNMVAVGMTGPRWVRLWMRCEVPGPHEVQISGGSGGPRRLMVTVSDGPEDKTAAVTYPKTNENPPLAPLTKYHYRIVRASDRAIVGNGAFETPPARDEDTPQKVVIALWSCHQPFTSDGTIRAESARMLRLLPKILRDNDVKFVLPCGDQIYADDPNALSLFRNPYLVRQSVSGHTDIRACKAEEVRRLYNTRYRTFWSSNPLREMYANYPTYPTLDDHEIKGDWGSERAHATKQFAALKTGALQAYYDYQMKGVLPPNAAARDSFHYDFNYGNIGIFVMDIRSQRAVDAPNPLFGDLQFRDFRDFLRNNATKKVLLIVTSVPVVHLADWLAVVGVKIINPLLGLAGKDIDFPDHWSHTNNRPARDAFLSLLHAHQQAHPTQRIAILSGDVHIGNAFGVRWKGGSSKTRLYQFTSSPVSAQFAGIAAKITTLGPRWLSSISARKTKFGPACEGDVHLLDGVAAATSNPLIGMNIGLIEVQRFGGESNLKFKLIGCHPDQDRPVTHFESGWLS